MPRTCEGRLIRAVHAACGLIDVAARILGVDAATSGKRADTSPRVAAAIAKAQNAFADRAELTFIEAAIHGEPGAVRCLLTARGRDRNSDAKYSNAGINELVEQEIAELWQRLGVDFQAPNLPQIYPAMTPK